MARALLAANGVAMLCAALVVVLAAARRYGWLPGLRRHGRDDAHAVEPDDTGNADPSTALGQVPESGPVVIGVIGAGGDGGTADLAALHVRALAARGDVEVVAIVDDPVVLGELQTAHPRVVTAGRLDSVLDTLDGLIVAVPEPERVDVSLTALAASVPVLIEPPVSPTIEDAQRLAEAAAMHEAIPRAFVAHRGLVSVAARRLRELVEDRQFGTLWRLEAVRFEAHSGHVLRGLGADELALVLALADEVPTTVRASIPGARGWVPAEWAGDNPHGEVVVELDFGRAGVMASVHVASDRAERVARLTAVGASAVAVRDELGDPGVRVVPHREVESLPAEFATPIDPDARYGSPDPMWESTNAVLDAFLRALDGTEDRLASVADGLVVMQVAEAAERALAEGRAIPLDQGRSLRR